MKKCINVDVSDEETGEMSQFLTFWESCAPQRDENGEVVYPFKTSLVSHYSLTIPSDDADEKCSKTFKRLSGIETSIEHIDPTTDQDPTVSYYRVHKAWDMQTADNNFILENIKRFLLLRVLPKVLETEDPGSSIYDYAAMQTAYRVTFDPGPEGVHQDSAVLTAVILINRVNCKNKSAVNRIWSPLGTGLYIGLCRFL